MANSPQGKACADGNSARWLVLLRELDAEGGPAAYIRCGALLQIVAAIRSYVALVVESKDKSRHRQPKRFDPYQPTLIDLRSAEFDYGAGVSTANRTVKNFGAGPREDARDRGSPCGRRGISSSWPSTAAAASGLESLRVASTR